MQRIILILLLSAIFFSGCRKSEDTVPEPEMSIYNFVFKKGYNFGLTQNVMLSGSKDTLSGYIPYDADITNLVASFEFVGAEVRIGEIVQRSGISVNNYSKLVTYTVIGNDGSTKDYYIKLKWFTGLPIIYINTLNGVEISSKEEYVPGNASIFGGTNYDDGSGEMKIRGRGHSTWRIHPKKPYQLKFENKTEVLGMPKDKKWIFLAEHSDKTLLRNSLAFEMGNISNLDWTPQSVFTEVFINDEYNGTYNVCQKVEESSNRVDIGEEGYLLEIDTPDQLDREDIYLYSTKFIIQVKEPEIAFESAEFYEIKNHIIGFESVLYSTFFKNPETGYRKYIDVNSFVDWYLINEIAKNQDSRSYSSMYFSYVPGEKIKMGPLWDFDLGFGNVDYSECEYPTGFWVKDHEWIKRLFEDPYFVNKVKERFEYFYNNKSYLIDFIDEKAEYLSLAQEENDKRWDVFGNYIWPNPVVYDTHQEEVNHLKQWLVTRMGWLNNEFKEM